MPGWSDLPDALLQREAVLIRVRRGVPADALVGLRVDHDEVELILAELASATGPSDTADPTGILRALDDAVAVARAGFAEEIKQDPVLGAIVDGANLADDEAEALALLTAVDIEPRRQRLVGYIQDDMSSVRVRLHTLVRLLGAGHPGVAAVAPTGILNRTGLVDVSSGQPWGRSEVVLSRLVPWAIAGVVMPDPALPPGARIWDATAAFTTPVDPDGLPGGPVLVVGTDPLRRREEAARRLVTRGNLIVGSTLSAPEWRAVVRTATLFGLGVLVEVEGELDVVAREVIEESPWLRWALLSSRQLSLRQLPEVRMAEFMAPSATATEAEWQATVGTPPEAGWRLSIDQLSLLARLSGASGKLPGVGRLAAGPLTGLATRIVPNRTISDLVAPDDLRAQILDVADRFRNRAAVRERYGLKSVPPGIIALFAGPPGTGKTVAAEIIAAELGLDVYRVDLSGLVSKWIGETEKNLEQVFALSESTRQVLVFDEADAVLGKRGEVTEARDRYANLGVSYLLQRFETYDGLIILTTNFRNNIDAAFTRRIQCLLDFPMPDAVGRAAIWRLVLAGAELDDAVDVQRLGADFELSGGVITAAAMSALHLAYADGATRLGNRHLALALRRELHKLGRMVPPGLLGES